MQVRKRWRLQAYSDVPFAFFKITNTTRKEEVMTTAYGGASSVRSETYRLGRDYQIVSCPKIRVAALELSEYC